VRVKMLGEPLRVRERLRLMPVQRDFREYLRRFVIIKGGSDEQ